MKKKVKHAFKVTPENKKETLEAFFKYYRLSCLLFDDRHDEIYNVSDLPKDNEFYPLAVDIAKQLGIDWNSMTHEDSNRIMLSLLEDSFNLIRRIENSKSIILKTTLIIEK